MKKLNPKIFISYTTRDGKINKNILSNLLHKISFNNNVYIDLIHNDSLDKQNRVIKELTDSDFIILIKTDQVDNSKWVNLEISLANELKIPIIEIEFDELIKKEYQPIIIAINKLISQEKLVNH